MRSVFHSTLAAIVLAGSGLLSASTASAAASLVVPAATSACTVTASGGDDAPGLLKAVQNSSCPTVTVPASTTLNIQTRLNMTGLANKHIVSSFITIAICIGLGLVLTLYLLLYYRVFRALLNSKRTLVTGLGCVFTVPSRACELSIDTFLQNGFYIPFQTQITFWLLGGNNIILDGGGTLDGSGQVC
jgi:galacturan 1,4-alpha-galacturonidase